MTQSTDLNDFQQEAPPEAPVADNQPQPDSQPQPDVKTWKQAFQAEAAKLVNQEKNADVVDQPQDETPSVDEVDPNLPVIEDHWPAEMKRAYETLKDNPDALHALVNTYKGFENRYMESRRTETEAQKVIDNNKQFFDDIKTQTGLYPSQYMTNVLETAKMLQQNPEHVIRWLAEQYNVPMGVQDTQRDDVQVDDDDYIDPTVKELKTQVANLTTQLHSFQQQNQSTALQGHIDRLNAEIDDGRWPYFDQVKDQVADLLRRKAVSGATPYDQMVNAYHIAVHSNNDLREAEIERRAEEKLKGKQRAFESHKVATSPVKKVAPTTSPSFIPNLKTKRGYAEAFKHTAQQLNGG